MESEADRRNVSKGFNTWRRGNMRDAEEGGKEEEDKRWRGRIKEEMKRKTDQRRKYREGSK